VIGLDGHAVNSLTDDSRVERLFDSSFYNRKRRRIVAPIRIAENPRRFTFRASEGDPPSEPVSADSWPLAVVFLEAAAVPVRAFAATAVSAADAVSLVVVGWLHPSSSERLADVRVLVAVELSVVLAPVLGATVPVPAAAFVATEYSQH
jgi:hypothetical protein